MGGAIARGLASGKFINTADISLCSPNHSGSLDVIANLFPNINTSNNNADAILGSDIIIIAVKPWLLDSVLREISPIVDFEHQIIISVVAGVSLETLSCYAGEYMAEASIFRVIPNTAIALKESMTIISSINASQAQIDTVKSMFAELGEVVVVEERLMGACTSLASCGIAYAMRYVRAAVEGGVELGLYPDQAKKIVLQTLLGAVKVLENSDANIEAEIDKVSTHGGITMKGLNMMEANGVSNAVGEGFKASTK